MNCDRSFPRFLATASVTSLAANWLWEMIQMPGYSEMAGKSWAETAIPCGIASLGDLLMTLIIFGLVALAAGTPCWAVEWRWNGFAAAAILGALFASGYEWRVLALGRWTYSPAMPVVPWIYVGLWPLLQLPLLVPASLAVGAVAARKSVAAPDPAVDSAGRSQREQDERRTDV